MSIKFYRPSDLSIAQKNDFNKGLEEVPALLKRLGRKHASIEEIDPRELTIEKVQYAYAEAIVPSAWKKYEVKRIFGTNRKSACFFGREVPALFVKCGRDDVGDIYPHRVGGVTVVTIRDFLIKALAEPA